MLTQLEIDQIVNESREADEGPTLLVRRVEAKVRKTCEVACAQALVYAVAVCAEVCENISEGYQAAEGMEYPELKTDAQDGAASCAYAIRALTPPR